MIEAVLFDMDGVLIDSEPAHARATSDALRQFELAAIDQAIFDRYFFGKTDWSSFRDYLQAIERPDIAVEAILQAKATRYAARFLTDVRPLWDGIETLRAASALGFRLAVVSGALAAEVDLMLERFDLRGLVPVTVSGDDVPDGKPNPAPYLLGAARLGVEPARCLVIEDAPAGVLAAQAAGMRCLAVDRLGQSDRLQAADRTVTVLTLDAIMEFADVQRSGSSPP